MTSGSRIPSSTWMMLNTFLFAVPAGEGADHRYRSKYEGKDDQGDENCVYHLTLLVVGLVLSVSSAVVCFDNGLQAEPAADQDEQYDSYRDDDWHSVGLFDQAQDLIHDRSPLPCVLR